MCVVGVSCDARKHFMCYYGNHILMLNQIKQDNLLI